VYTRVQISHIYALFSDTILQCTDPHGSALVSNLCQKYVNWCTKAYGSGGHRQRRVKPSRSVCGVTMGLQSKDFDLEGEPFTVLLKEAYACFVP